ncbi:hypothetical protein ORI89_17500, partial [Sphingobacterium sp. UT-1RO-CII-1]|uniref:hypothetical protein n=1 Tax=Sphingobacterium sp. UT-1RO-CII-1 TaxID=2995225 RepID=UPI00227CDAB4
MIYEIKRGNTVVWRGKAIGAQYRKIMQEDRVEVEINSPSTLAFKKGDSIVVYGRTYKINRPTNITRKNTQVGYAYNIEFEALYYDLGKWGLFTLDKNNNLTERNVYLMSDAKTLLGLALQNANRASSGWSLGVIDDTEVFQWSFSSAKILSALQEVADKTGLELWFDDKTINLTRRQPNTGLKLEYGKGNELYELYRTRRENPVVTHLYITGGSRNIPNNYGYSNIQPTGGNPLVNPNYSNGDDIVEDFHVYDNIYPRLHASVTSVVSENVIRSSDIDFDLNDHLLDNGLPAQIVFTSGQLVGFTFTISENGYNHATRQVTFNKIVDDPAYPDGVPSNLLKPAVGDSFVFLQIDMPQVYVTGSENKVLDIGNSYFADNGIEQYNWSCKPIPRFLLEQEVELILGGIVNLKATDIGYNGNIRIDSYVRDLQKAHRYEFTLSNIIGISEFARERNKSDKLADTVTRNLGDGGLQINTTYAEKAGYAERAGRADIATHAATADTAGHANTADLATHSLTANHANTSDLATRALRADLSDNSILWNGLAQPNYLTQPVRPLDSPKFEGIGSQSYVSGWAGHGYALKKDANGNYVLEIDDLFVRGEANFYSLVVNELKGTNGAVVVSDGIKITGATKTGANYNCTIDTDGGKIVVPFKVGDVLKCQVWNGKGVKYLVARVLTVVTGSFTISILDGSSIPAEGDELVRIDSFTDNNRKGVIYITASDSGAPFIDTVYGMWTDRANSVRTRMGNLAGIVSPIFGTLADFGFYGKRAYLEEAHVHGTLIATSGSNVYNKSETQAEISNAEGRINLQVTNKIDAIQIGGRNLLLNSELLKRPLGWSSGQQTDIEHGVVTIRNNASVRASVFFIVADREFTLKSGDVYIIGFWYSLSSAATSYVALNTASSSASNQQVISYSANYFIGDNTWRYVEISFTKDSFANHTGLSIGFQANAPDGSVSMSIKEPKLIQGTKMDGFSVAPEDVAADINAVQSSVTNLAVTVDSNTQSITSKAERTEVNALGNRVSTAEEKITPDAINFTVKAQVDSKSTGRMIYRDPSFESGLNSVKVYN